MAFLKLSKRRKETTKFFNAAKQGSVNEIKKYIDKGKLELVKKKDDDDWTPLFWSCFNGHYEVTKALINAGAEVGIEDKQGRSPLYLHCGYHGDTEITRLLIKSGSNVIAKNKDGWSTLHICAFRGSVAPIEVLIDAGADLLQVDNANRTPFDLASMKKHEEVITTLKKFAKNLLFTSVKQGKHSNVLQYLEKYQIDVNAKDLTGWTALHFAVQLGNEMITKLLLSCGADPSIANMKGQTPEMIAKELGNLAMVKILQNHIQEQIRKNKSDLLMERENQIDILARKQAIKENSNQLRKRSATSTHYPSSPLRKKEPSADIQLTSQSIEKPPSSNHLSQVEEQSVNHSVTPTVNSTEILSTNPIMSSPKPAISTEDKISAVLEILKRKHEERKTALQQAKEQAIAQLTSDELITYLDSKKPFQNEDLMSQDELEYLQKKRNAKNKKEKEKEIENVNNNEYDKIEMKEIMNILDTKNSNINKSQIFDINFDSLLNAIQTTKIDDSPSLNGDSTFSNNISSPLVNNDLEDLLDSLGITDIDDEVGNIDSKDVFRLLQKSIDNIGELLS